MSYTYANNPHAFPDYLDGFPCNALIELIATDPKEMKRLRRCYVCDEYYSGDPRSMVCEQESCKNLLVNFRKTWERDTGRDKSTINADNETIKTAAYQKMAKRWNETERGLSGAR